ncbi:MAG: hypothetical protein ACKO81_05575, partial [Planctomycetota bacterium]
HYQESHAALIYFDVVHMLVRTLLSLANYIGTLAVLDILFRKFQCHRQPRSQRPVKHWGCFFYFEIFFCSYGLSMPFLPMAHLEWYFVVFMGVMAIPAVISEWLIFWEKPPTSDDGE